MCIFARWLESRPAAIDTVLSLGAHMSAPKRLCGARSASKPSHSACNAGGRSSIDEAPSCARGADGAAVEGNLEVWVTAAGRHSFTNALQHPKFLQCLQLLRNHRPMLSPRKLVSLIRFMATPGNWGGQTLHLARCTCIPHLA